MSPGQEEMVYFVTDTGLLQAVVVRGKECKKVSPFNKNLLSSSSQKTMFIVDLKPQDLPSEVQLPNTWFEVWDPIAPDLINSKKVKFQVTGDITKYIQSKNQYESLIGNANINEKTKKTISMVFKFDSADLLLAGVRINMDVRKKN
jgi:hypothetical protein